MTQRSRCRPAGAPRPRPSRPVSRRVGCPSASTSPVHVRDPGRHAGRQVPGDVHLLRRPGCRRVVRHSTVTLVDASCAASSDASCALALTYDERRHGDDDAPNAGNFDGSGWSFDAASAAGRGRVDESAGSPTRCPTRPATADELRDHDAASSWRFRRAVLDRARARRRARRRLTSSATVTYTDGTTADVPFALTDWAGSAAQRQHGRHRDGSPDQAEPGHRRPAGQRSSATTLPLAPNKTVQSIALPNNADGEIYAITLTP